MRTNIGVASKISRNSLVKFTEIVTVNTEIYAEILRRLRNTVREETPRKMDNQPLALLHDNAPGHRSVLVNNFLAKNNMITLEHPPYSPLLAPADFYLFPPHKSA